ncbi:hypothetical protein H8959_008561 [Pygathrix nigripes]
MESSIFGRKGKGGKRLLDLEHQGFSPDSLLPFQQGLVQLQLLLQQLLSLVQLNCAVGLGSC